MSQQRIAIIGGGIIGLACAWRLARDGHQLVLFDAAMEALEASWAAAGMLAPHNEAEEEGPLYRLSRRSLAAWPGFLKAMGAEPEAVDHREHGCLIPALDEADHELVAQRRELLETVGVSAAWLEGAELREQEPALAPEVEGALRVPGGHVNPRAVSQVLRERCADLGVELRYACPVGALEPGEVRTAAGDRVAVDQVVLAAGAWTPGLATLTGLDLVGEPVKGQMLLIEGGEDRLHHFVHCRHAYCVPRAGSGVVVGATMVREGFDRSEDEAAIEALASGARRLFPHLERRPVAESWTGLRPRLAGGMPLLARVDERLVVATGHFRNGILLTPVTAEIVADLVADRPSEVPTEPFGLAAHRR